MAAFTSSFLKFLFFSSISSLSLPLSLWCFVSLSVCFILRHYIPSLCFSFVSLSIFYDSPLGSPNRSILVLYFLSLKPWRWIIEQTDLWLHSCRFGVCVCLCLFSVSISVSRSSSRLFMPLRVSEQFKPFFTCVYGAALVSWAVRNVSPGFEQLLLVMRPSNQHPVWFVCVRALT